MLKLSGVVVTLLTALTLVVADLPSRPAVALGLPGPTATQAHERLFEQIKVCKPCRVRCKRGYVCKCNRCVRAGRQCRPQSILCKKGYVYKCNRCVRRKR